MIVGPARALRAGSHLDHERAVDLQRVHGQLGQVAERREAGAEVVDRDRHAHGADRLQAGDAVLDVSMIRLSVISSSSPARPADRRRSRP
jgi:hypothetical protein